MSNEATRALSDIAALRDEFGLEFQLADPDEPVTTVQRTINDMFFALLEARESAKAAYESGFAAGQASIDEAVVDVLQGRTVTVHQFSEGLEWTAEIDNGWAPGGTGDTPTAAILDACRKAKEGSGE